MDYALEGNYTTDKQASVPAMEEFDRELERCEKLAMAFADRLDPVLNQYARTEAVASEPRPEASSHVRGRIERLRVIAAKFDRLLADIDL